MIASGRSRTLLTFALFGNLAALGYYKYSGFIFHALVGLGADLVAPAVTLPIGISFFTFTQIAYLVDAYRGEAREYRPIHYALFVTYFPHLIAGPILHHKEMIPQFERARTYDIDLNNLALGLTWFSSGLFKKVVLADNIAPHVNAIFKLAEGGLSSQCIGCLAGLHRIRVAALLRFLRLLRHGDGIGSNDGHPVSTEFFLPLQGHIANRVLAALAYDAISISTRLSLHPAWRQSGR
jgi:hypothetical protein